MSLFREKIKHDCFLVTSELSPPKGTDLTKMLEIAGQIGLWVDAFNLTDSASSRMSLSPIAAAHGLRMLGFEPIIQMTTRDKNRIALQGDLLGAAYLGAEIVVCMGGDPPHLGDHPEAKPVFDLSTIELIQTVAKLNGGKDMAMNKLNAPTYFLIGAVCNPGAQDMNAEIERTHAKVEAGARFLQTQAVYDLERLTEFVERISDLEVKVLAGIIPVKSTRMARYMNDKIPGIEIPERVIARVEAAKDAKLENIQLLGEIVQNCRGLTSGVHIMAMGWETLIPDILTRAGLAPGS